MDCDHRQTSIITLILINQDGQLPFLPPEVVHMILMYAELLSWNQIHILSLGDLIRGDDRYRLDWPSFPTGTIPDLKRCAQYGAHRCLVRYMEMGGVRHSYAYSYATMYNQVKFVERLYEYGFVVDYNTCAIAVENGRVDIVRLLLNNGLVNIYECEIVREYAVANGQIEILQCFYEHGHSFSGHAYATAAKNNDIRMVEWLIEHKYPLHLLAENTNRGKLTLQDTLCVNSCKYAHFIAAKAGNLQFMQWLHGRGFQPGRMSYMGAAENGHLNIMQWLFEIRTETSHKLWSIVAATGRIDILQWMFDHKITTCAKKAYKIAAKHGHLDVLRWCLEHDIRRPSKICRDAIRNGHLECIQLLQENAFRVPCTICDIAAKYKHYHILEWAHANNFAKCDDSTTMVV